MIARLREILGWIGIIVYVAAMTVLGFWVADGLHRLGLF